VPHWKGGRFKFGASRCRITLGRLLLWLTTSPRGIDSSTFTVQVLEGVASDDGLVSYRRAFRFCRGVQEFIGTVRGKRILVAIEQVLADHHTQSKSRN
jgi:hypothetical protein